jgi:hypothetical protein
MLQFRWDVLQPTALVKLPLHNAQAEASLPLIDKHQLARTEGLMLRAALDHAVTLRAAGDDLVLVSLGRRLLQTARKEGLLTFNTETGTQAGLEALLGP